MIQNDTQSRSVLQRARAWVRARPRRVVLATAATLLLVAMFHPRLQTALIERQLQAAVDSFAVTEVHLLPWSLRIDNLSLTHDGARVRIGRARMRLGLWKLALGTLRIGTLRLNELEVDLREVAPSDEPAAPPPGLFATLDRGFGLELDTVEIAGRIRLADETEVRLRITGGGIAPGQTGRLAVAAEYARGVATARVAVAGTASVDQHEGGEMSGLGVELQARASLPRLPREEVIDLALSLSPSRLDPAAAEAGGSKIGDRFVLEIARPGSPAPSARVAISGVHDPDAHTVAAEYELALDGRLLAAYLPAARLPRLSERARGQLTADLAAGSATLTFDGDLEVAELERVLGRNQRLPPTIAVRSTFSLDLTAESLALRSLAMRVEGDTDVPLVDVVLTDTVAISFADPDAALQQTRTRAAIDIAGLPLPWLNGLLPQPLLAAGALAGRFELLTGEAGLMLAPVADLAADAVRLEAPAAAQDSFALRLSPRLRYVENALSLQLSGIEIARGGERLLGASLNAAVPLGGNELPAVSLTLDAELDLVRLAELPPVARHLGGVALPPGLEAVVGVALRAGAGRVELERLDVQLGRADRPAMVRLATLTPVGVELGNGPPRLASANEVAARLTLAGIPLELVQSLIPGVTLAGEVHQGAFELAPLAGGSLRADATAPLELHGVAVEHRGARLVEALALSLRPSLQYDSTGLQLSYEALEGRIDGARALSGEGRLALAFGGESPPGLEASGRLAGNVAGLVRLPLLRERLGAGAPESAWQLAADYALQGDATRIEISRLNARLEAGGKPHLTLANDGPLTLRTRIAAEEALAQHATGALSLVVNGLSSTLLDGLLPLGGLGFEELSATASLRSDGKSLTAVLDDGFMLTGVRLDGEAGPILAPFSVAAAAELQMSERRIEAAVETLELSFDSHPEAPALDGKLAFTLETQRAVPLRRLQAKLKGALPPLLAQPPMLPGHGLAAGVFRLDLGVDEAGRIDAGVVLDALEAEQRLAIDYVEGRAAGAVNPDGEGFELSLPLTGRGRSGESDLLLDARYAPSSKQASLLEIELTSRKFLLNDFLAAIDAVRASEAGRRPSAKGTGKVAEQTGAAGAAEAPDTTPAAEAFWAVLPVDARLRYRIDDLYYTDYMIFRGVSGTIGLSSNRFALESLAAQFHDSPLRLDGALDFVPGAAEPYRLALRGKVEDFDLNRFFSELVPGQKPRVEGLFSVDLDASGSAPNIPQYRNELLFNLDLASRDGLFRPLPPGSALLASASDALGIVGEALSYTPTGGFGAGALSRLVNYISVIDYDRIAIHVVRDDTRDLVIREFSVRSPTIHLTAQGGIDFASGTDILDSPLLLDARLNMSGKGAAILYSMNLMQEEQDPLGYHLGPAFRIRGTLAAAESNLAEILTAAKQGMIKGGITRPLSGLVGNVKHRWLGEPPLPYQQENAASEAATSPTSEQDIPGRE